jgi:hypothetical protein
VRNLINNLAEAVRFYNEKILNDQGCIAKTFNGSRGPIAKRLIVEKNAYNHIVFFKKSWHEFFGKQFRKTEQRGQTCRLVVVQEAATFGEVIGVVHPDGGIYTCPAQDWLSYARQNGTVWIPKGEEEEEASIPASMMRPWNAVVDQNSAHSTFETGSNNMTDRERWEKHIDDYSKGKLKKGTTLDGWM